MFWPRGDKVGVSVGVKENLEPMSTIQCLSAYVGPQGSINISAASFDLARDCIKTTVRTLWISTAWLGVHSFFRVLAVLGGILVGRRVQDLWSQR